MQSHDPTNTYLDLVIDSIDTVIVGGVKRRRFITNDTCGRFGPDSTLFFIEGIGSSKGAIE